MSATRYRKLVERANSHDLNVFVIVTPAPLSEIEDRLSSSYASERVGDVGTSNLTEVLNSLEAALDQRFPAIHGG